MATPIQLTLTMDASGAITGVDQFNKQIASIGPTAQAAASKASQGFNGIESAERQAHIAGQLFVRTTGIEMPRALETVIARSQTLGPILQSLFGVSVFAAAIPAITTIGEKIYSITEQMGGYTDEIKKMEQETIQASRQSFINPDTLGATMAHLQQVNAEIVQIGEQKQALDAQSAQGPSFAQQMFGLLPLGDLATIYAQEKLRNQVVAQGVELESQRDALLKHEQQQIAQMVNSLEDQAKLVGLTGKALIDEQERQAVAQYNSSFGVRSQQNEATYQRGITAIHSIYNGQRADLSKQAAQREQQSAQETMSLRHQVTEDALTGLAKVYQTETDQLESLDEKFAEHAISEKNYYAQRALIAQRTDEQIAAFEQRLKDQTVSLQNQAALSAVSGDDRIKLSAQQQIDSILESERQAHLELIKDPAERARLEGYYAAQIAAVNQMKDQQILASDKDTAVKRQQILEQAAEEQTNAEQTVALATVNEWNRAYAQIEIEAQNRIAAIDKAERNALKDDQLTANEQVAIESAAQAKREAVWAETNQKILEEHKKQVEQLGADLESVFDDIGSGNIGKRILDNMKKLFFQILAEWLMTTQTMGSGFGSLFGNMVFGPGSTGANFFGGSSGGGNMGILGASSSSGTAPFLPGGVSSGSTASLGAGFFPGTASTGIVPGAGGFAPLAGDTSSTSLDSLLSSAGGGGTSTGTSNGTFLDSLLSSSASGSMSALFGGSAANALTTQSIGMFSSGGMSLGSGVPGALAAPVLGNPLGSITGNLFSMSSLPGLASLVTMIGGSKLGGVGQVGAMISALAIMASASPGGVAASMLSSLGPSAGLVGTLLPLIGEGLLGFGIGMQTGPVLGSIAGGAAGAGIGALTAVLSGFSGPIGALIGGIVGLLSGLFGGLFGGSKRKKAANNYFTQQIQPAITQIENEFKSFQLDYASANSQLESLRSQAQDQLSKLKGEGKSVFKDKVSPAIDEAEKEINQFETERERRSGLVFGPPQFHAGGYVEAATSAWTTKPGEMMAVLKRGEFVMDPVATANNRPLLERMNAGQKIGNTHTVVLNVSTMDAKSFDGWARTGGAQMIASALQRHTQEGH